MPESSAVPTYWLLRIKTPEQFALYKDDLAALCHMHADVLCDDAPNNSPQSLVGNLAKCMPYLWLALNAEQRPIGASSLTGITFAREAYLHGVRDVHFRKHPAVTALALAAIETAFAECKVHKVKAQFEATNRQAAAFCWRFGFCKEAHFARDNKINGRWEDVVVYSLFSNHYHATTRRRLTHVLWSK